MTKPLTDAELAELRDRLRDAGWRNGVDHFLENDRLPRLLDELERGRVAAKVVGTCKHKSSHAPYCASCCASFDPGRMVLIHEPRCAFRGHERS